MAGLDAVCTIAILIIPLVAGISILNNPRRTPLSIMAAILTLKPVFLTLIWMMLKYAITTPGTSQDAIYAGLETLSTIIVIAVAIFAFRSLFFGYEARQAAWLLLALDTLRWLSTLGLSTVDFMSDSVWLFGIASITMPTIFAFTAWVIADKEAERPPRKQKSADV
jgi:hypothetical protein